jgi:histidyl-tRNA synthetase
MQSAPSILDYLDEGDGAHFAEVCSMLDDLLIPYEVDPRIVRGLDYYARTVWEFEPAGGGGQSTVGAGGRYDGLIELLGGPHTPGVGFATGIERIVLNLRERGAVAPDPGLDLFIAPLGEVGPRAAQHLAREVRASGLAVRSGFPGRGLRAYFRAAEAAGARFIAIVGDDEAGRGVVQLKPLAEEGEQREVSVADVTLLVMPRW